MLWDGLENSLGVSSAARRAMTLLHRQIVTQRLPLLLTDPGNCEEFLHSLEFAPFSRKSTILFAKVGPIPGSDSNCLGVAVFRLRANKSIARIFTARSSP